MAKAPVAGAVKTRLVPPLTTHEAAELSAHFLRDIAQNIAQATVDGRTDGLIAYAPLGAEAAFDGLLPADFRLLPQRGDSLGDRLFNAATDLLAGGYGSLCLINADSPTLPPVLLETAIEVLARPGDRVVIGESEDGGYYLIGLSNSHRELFEGIAWSTAAVFTQTVERARGKGLEVAFLPSWYDVDDKASLASLCDELFPLVGERSVRGGMSGYAAPHTRRYLAQLIAAGRLDGTRPTPRVGTAP
jgi:rSAM/selenodomain-associated transferase 1